MLAACKGEQAPAAPAPTLLPAPAPEAPPPVAAPEAPPPAAAPARLRYRIANQTGDVKDERGPLGQHWSTPVGGSLAIDLPNGARLTLEPETRVVLLDSAPGAIVLLAGQLHVQLLPQGAAPGRTPLRIATTDASFAIPVAGEIWLGPGYAAVLAGIIERELPATTDVPPEPESIAAGQALHGLTAKASSGPRTLDQVHTSYARLRGRAAAPLANAGEEAERALLRALDAWDAADARATELLSGQRAAKQRSDDPAAHAAQRELVELAQSKLAIRRRVRAAFELAAAHRLVAADAAELAAFESRVVARAAAAMPSGL